MLVHSWPELVIEWENDDIGEALIWYRILGDDH
jgi:hypothetical protein